MAARTNSAPRSNRVLVISLVVIAALVAVLVGGELFVRNRVKTCMADQFESQLGSQVDVGLSWKPVLLQSVDKNVPYITIDSDDTKFGPAQGMQVHAQVNDIRIENTADSSGTIGSSDADITWSTAGILATLQQQAFGSLISGVTADSSAGTLRFSVGPAGLADLTVKPEIVNGTVKVQTVGAEILGFGLPTDLVDGVVQTLTSSLQTYPLGMQPTSLKVTDDAIEITLEGGAYTMPAAGTQQQQQEQQSSCGLLV
ncbi:hypothetical protein OPAG_00647 [Rhodococcus opacus PD630]|uniref:LmeA family phospholipid-binding protein n=1 Tax=Rhodococcus TaxID=1827 RepID=UPI00029CCC9C|nr:MULTISPECIES: DUF2993 domain-containing protein [Rhodococcus]RZK71471.1 MAG: DUF2993 domain-containing protein [Rhodococcus sp. (in: high G+C Gram-positive bacteria)]EHI40606.1 hypothetical protein OPAG_00647 [Rhodococcus opacus PD630]KXX56466.1 hypothetical protein AZG88_14085 [Rhodococcus sp. LB1]PBC57211.1 DUF2993 domain-containing protein [Rhodococcus sp. ACPA1]UDG95730.1 DUF2993 domain-containing protein [Rhodococcus opacus PD630]